MKFSVAFALFASAATAAAQLSNEYLPPHAGGNAIGAGSASYSVAASAPAPEVAYAAPVAAYESYEDEASEPAHTFSQDDGYRYKTQRRRVVRRQRRDVGTEYLPPVAEQSAPAASYEAPAASYSAQASYSTPVGSASYTESYEGDASAPAHSFSQDDGYRYKTQRRRVVVRRQRRDVGTEYLPPVADHSAPAASYAAPAQSEVSYAAPAAAVESYDVEASAPAHSFSQDDGYRYKTQRRVVVRRNRY